MSQLLQTTDQNFDNEVLKSEVPVLVNFSAPWCMPCRMQTPILESLQNRMGDHLKVVKVNTDENSSLAQKYSIMSIPTLMIFNNGEIVDQMVGMQNENQLEEKLHQFKK